ncbi:MAG: ATP-binding cassette domain-containing protein [Alphaproteobacteria bacterium]|nr:ATP-binding cassette domain-containing protein [Alphaproteobacteria bacterium]
MPLVEMRHVHRSFERPGGGTVWAVNDVSLEITAGQTVALIGESGSGKSTLGRLVLGLLAADSGSVLFDGVDLAALTRGELRRLRARMGVVFQEPFESLNPRLKIAAIVEEPLIIHRPALSSVERQDLVAKMLREVDMDPQVMERYPQALSGGQQQRIGIARALIMQPSLIVLDEPTSSLDLSVRAQILNLFGTLKAARGLTYLFISHDITTVEYFSDEIAVLYLGCIVERGTTTAVLDNPRHPYTQALLSARLSVDPKASLPHLPLSGDPPSPTRQIVGCPLVGRCPRETAECSMAAIPLRQIAPDHHVACIHV